MIMEDVMLKALLRYKVMTRVAGLAASYLAKKSTRRAAARIVKKLMVQAADMLDGAAVKKYKI